jgi:hypothetical protein
MLASYRFLFNEVIRFLAIASFAKIDESFKEKNAKDFDTTVLLASCESIPTT